MSDKPVDEQMLLFAPFFSERHNRVFDLYDALPRFVLTWKREVSDKAPKVITFSNVRIGDQTVSVQITPAVVVDTSQPAPPPVREGVPQRLPAKLIFPGSREEIIEFALRRMAAIQHADMKIRSGKKADQVTLTFRLSQLREQLAEDGHHFKGAEIAEALNVLAKSKIQLSGDVPEDVAEGYRWQSTQAYSMLEDLRVIAPKEGDHTPDGDRTSYYVSFHPLAAAAILQGRFFDHNHRRTMQLRKPLARWIIKRMNLRYRQAQKNNLNQGYKLSLTRVMAESGMLPEKRLRASIERIREALQELKSTGWLSRFIAFDEAITFWPPPKTGGQKAIKEIVWTLHPSSDFCQEVIEGNKMREERLTKGQRSLSL